MLDSASTFIATFLSSLTGKLNSAVPQIDFGNFTVGVATILIAFITLFVALRSNSRANNQKIAEFRQQWIDDLRDQVSYYFKISHQIATSFLVAGNEKVAHQDTQDHYAELFELEYYVRLKLNPGEQDHQDLVKAMVAIRNLAEKMRKPDQRSCETIEAFKQARLKLVNITKRVLKSEWDRLKDEIHGRGKFNRYLRNQIRSAFGQKQNQEW